MLLQYIEFYKALTRYLISSMFLYIIVSRYLHTLHYHLSHTLSMYNIMQVPIHYKTELVQEPEYSLKRIEHHTEASYDISLDLRQSK